MSSPAARSPSISPTIEDDDDPSPPFLARRSTIGDPVYDGQAIARHRRRVSIIACERCRRRKIRCDGNQPCATCARFGVRCTKPERINSTSAEHAALVDRVQMLEARLAAVSAAEQQSPSHSMPSRLDNDLDHSRLRRPDLPSLHIDTNLANHTIDISAALISPSSYNAPTTDDMCIVGSGGSGGDDFLSPHNNNNNNNSNVPTIQITGPHGSHPSSPLPFSPAPSLFSGTSRASSPDPYSSALSFDFSNTAMSPLMLTPASHTHARTPPLNQWAEVYDRNALLRAAQYSPGGDSLHGHGHYSGSVSRRSSITSFGGLGEALCTPQDGTHGNTNSNILDFGGMGISIDMDMAYPAASASSTQTHIPSTSPQQLIHGDRDEDADWGLDSFLLTHDHHHNTHNPSLVLHHPSPPPLSRPILPLPPKPTAEALSDLAFTTHSLPLEHTAYRICFEAVYASAPGDSSTTDPPPLQTMLAYTSYSLRMARCLVSLVLAIGIKIRDGHRADDDDDDDSTAAGSSCHALAMQLVAASGLEFWEEWGAKDVLGLLAVLAGG